MNVLDENIVLDQRLLLTKWKVHFRRIVDEAGRWGVSDDDILPLLHRLRRPTFFTRDADYRSRGLCHNAYCLVFLDVRSEKSAEYIRRMLRQSVLNSAAKGMSTVIQLSEEGMRIWRLHKPSFFVEWQS